MTTNTIYVSSNSNDITGNGTLLKPYATLGKVASVLKNSTKILIEKGSVFYNDILNLASKNNIVVDSYGTGNAPLISGFKSITGWTNEGGNIWSHQDNNFPDEITNVFIGGYRAIIGRSPKAAYSTCTGGSSSTLVDSARTEADGFWNGAELVVRYYDWATGISRISDYTNKTFTFPVYYQDEETNYSYSVGNGKKYFIQNHVSLCTAQNEWAYNNVTKTLYIYSVAEPANVTASYGTDALCADGAKFITIQNINITGAQRCGININNSKVVKIDHVNFQYSGIYSMLVQNSNEIKITNTTGYHQNNDFLNMYQCDNIFIEDNEGLYCGIDTGACRYMRVFARGGTGGLTGHLINNAVVRHNHIAYTSYSAIAINFGPKFLIEENHTHHFNLNKYDGGGLSCNTATFWHLPTRDLYLPVIGSRMIRNIVHDGNVTQNSYGPYIDNYSQGFEMAYNFGAGCRWNIILHESIRNYTHDNMAVQENGSEAGISYGMSFPTTKYGIIDGNKFVNATPSAASIYSISEETQPQTMKNNKYCYPLGKKGTVTDDSINKLGSAGFTLAEWIADESRVVWTRTGEEELFPSINPYGLMSDSDFVFYLLNPSKVAVDKVASDLPFDDYVDLDGNAVSFPITLQPYEYGVYIRAPKPVFSKGYIDNDIKKIKIETTVRLNESVVPATSSFAIAGKTITNVSISGNVITLTTTEDNIETDNLSVVYTKPVSNPITAYYGVLTMDSFTGSANVTSMLLTSTGTGAGVSTLRLIVTADITLTLTGTGRFYSDSAGTLDESSTYAVTGTTLKTVYIKVPSGTSNLIFSDHRKVEQIMWYGLTNCPTMGGDLSRFLLAKYLLFAGNNTVSGDMSECRDLSTLSFTASNPNLSGSTKNMTKLESFDVRGSSSMTLDFSRAKKIYYIYLSTNYVLSSATVNKILADVWYNKDQFRNNTVTRTLNLLGHASSGAPTGQGLVDKANLQNYRAPFNQTTNPVWTLSTR
jgi:hypothetical protein